MIWNAAILRIDSPGSPDPGGNRAIAAGAAMSCRCCLSAPTAQDRYSGFGLEAEGSVMLRVKLAQLDAALAAAGYAAGFALAPELRLSIEPDKAEGPLYYRLRNVTIQPHGAGSVVVGELRMD